MACVGPLEIEVATELKVMSPQPLDITQPIDVQVVARTRLAKNVPNRTYPGRILSEKLFRLHPSGAIEEVT